MRIDVIVNRTAHLHVKRPDLAGRMRRIAGADASVHETASVDELGAVCRELAVQKSDLVILSGGDGSFMAGVTAMARAFGEKSLPRVAFLPGGTAATVARNWGMRGDPAELLVRIVERRGRVSFRRRPTLRVANVTSANGVEERIGFIFGTGLVAKFFDLYYREGARGYAGAARIVARIFAESFYGGSTANEVLEPLPCALEVEGRRLPQEAWSLVCSSVVRNLGIHMMVTYRAGADPTRLHLVASPLRSRELGPRAPLVLAGRRIGGRGHFDELVRDFSVHFGGASSGNGAVGAPHLAGGIGASDGPFVLDGDMLRGVSVHVSVGPSLDVADLSSAE